MLEALYQYRQTDAEAQRVPFERARTVSAVTNAVASFYRREAGGLLKTVAALAGPVVLVALLGQYLLVYGRFGDFVVAAEGGGDELLDVLAGLTWGSLISSALNVIANAFAATVALGYLKEYLARPGARPSVRTVWPHVRRAVLPVGVLFTLATFAAMMGWMVALVPCLGVLLWIGLVLLLAPYVAVTAASKVLEDVGLTRAFDRAQTVLKKRKRIGAGALFIALGVWLIFSITLILPVAFIAVATAVNTGDYVGMMEYLSAAATLVGLLGYFFVTIPAIAGGALLLGLREETHAPDLMAALDALEAEALKDAPGGDGAAAPAAPSGTLTGRAL